MRVLVVDDDAAIRDVLSDALTTSGFAVVAASNGTEALATLAATPIEVVLTDVRMEDLDGLGLLRILRERSPDIDVVLMTAYDDMQTVIESMKHGAVQFLVKPLDLTRLTATLRKVFADRTARATPPASPATAPTRDFVGRDLVGRDPQMIEVYKLVGQAAVSIAAVLIRGESGTGKELVARAIHANSALSTEPFVPINCAALPPTLLESELFGHVRGAFTGAVSNRRGRFAQAGRGVIFLDEIGDTSLDFQTKLLRVLQDREYQPVGSDETERTEARVIAATHQNLEAMVVAGSFREDLYYRLRVVEIAIPPLRARLGDLATLAEHLVARISRALSVSTPLLAADAMKRLGEHAWPGNVRELENCLTRAIVVASGGVLRAEHLSFPEAPSTSASVVPTLADLEREHIVRVLALSTGNHARAARVLGISRPRLRRLIERYGLS